jgi:hypothetical protein
VSVRRLGLPAALLIAGAALLAHANGVPGGFTYDDKAIVPRQPPHPLAVRRGRCSSRRSTSAGRRGAGPAYRPLLLLSFAVQWWIHGGDATAFRAVNLLLHVAATLLLARFLLELGFSRAVAVGAALLFAVQPIHVEAVASVVGRGETQAAALTLVSLLLALRAADPLRTARRRGLALAGAVLAYALAVLTKESAAVAPALLFLGLAWKAEGPALSPAAPGGRGIVGVRGRAAAAMLASLFAVRSLVLGGALKGAATGIFELENPLAPLRWTARAANACAVLLRYVGRIVVPLRLSADESAWSIPVLAPGSAMFLLAPALLLALSVAAAARLLVAS